LGGLRGAEGFFVDERLVESVRAAGFEGAEVGSSALTGVGESSTMQSRLVDKRVSGNICSNVATRPVLVPHSCIKALASGFCEMLELEFECDGDSKFPREIVT